MQTALFDFDLPAARIALRPAVPRDASRLLVVRPPASLTDARFTDIVSFLKPGDALVLNDTRVIAAQLKARRRRLGQSGEHVNVQINLHQCTAPCHWQVFAKPLRRLHAGDELDFCDTLTATVTAATDGLAALEFHCTDTALQAYFQQHGAMPLPPYIAALRASDAQDREDYQTLYARHEGSVAAPTAGLHFTHDLLERVQANGVNVHFLTLHVGAGTFLPVRADKLEDHVMHAEHGALSLETADALNAAKAAGGRILAVGTTSLRLLEAACDGQGRLHPFNQPIAIFIKPGYRFRCVDGLITNFHLPRSTLFMLVCALCGIETMQNAYRHAIENAYRFYSYGDACLLLPERA